MFLLCTEMLFAYPQPPTTFATYPSLVYKIGDTIIFNAGSSHDNDYVEGGQQPYWLWQFDYKSNIGFIFDKNSVSPVVEHSYSQPGTYQIAVKYFDDDGEEGNIFVMNITIYPAYYTPGRGITSINLRFLIEGLYEPDCDYSVSDTVAILLYFSNMADVSESYTQKTVFDFLGNASVSFEGLPIGNFYIGVQHRNSIRTWTSKIFNDSSQRIINYDFTVADTQAFAQNMKMKGNKWCFYSGDVDQDGFIGNVDLTMIDNAAFISAEGYLPEDLDGDGFVGNVDLTIADNNAYYMILEYIPVF